MRTLIHICALMFALGCDDSGAGVERAIVELEAGRECSFDHDCMSNTCVFGRSVNHVADWLRFDPFGGRDGYCSMLCADGCVGGFECSNEPDLDSGNDAIACIVTGAVIGGACESSIECAHECFLGKCDGGPCPLGGFCDGGLTCFDYSSDGVSTQRCIRRGNDL